MQSWVQDLRSRLAFLTTAMILCACSLVGSAEELGTPEIVPGSAGIQEAETPTAQPAGPLAPQEVILQFGADQDRFGPDFAALHTAIDADVERARTAALENLDAESPGARFAALYTLALTAEPGESQEALFPFLDSTETTERILAAQALLVRGEKSAIPVLIAALDSSEENPYWDPPLQAWETASFALFQFTHVDLGLVGVEDSGGTAAAKPAWEQWWIENQDSLVWDPESQVWEVKR